MTTTTKKFEHGPILTTAGIDDDCRFSILFSKFVIASLKRHLSGDWGRLCNEDWQANEDALEDGNRLFSAYEDDEYKFKIWIITEADRSATTILFPSEY